MFFRGFLIVSHFDIFKIKLVAAYPKLLFYSENPYSYLSSLDLLWCPLGYSDSHLFSEIHASCYLVWA
jgi:hypothetical protein